MNGIKTMAASICLTLLACGIFSLLIPKSNLEKVMKFALGVFFLSSVVFPFTQGNLDFSFSFSSTSLEFSDRTVEEGVEQSLIGIGQQKVTAEIEAILEKNNVRFEKVETQIHIDEENNITISKIKISLPRSGHLQTPSGNLMTTKEIADLVEKEAGIRPIVE